MGGRESFAEELPFNDRPAPLKDVPALRRHRRPFDQHARPNCTSNIVNTSWGGALYTISQ